MAPCSPVANPRSSATDPFFSSREALRNQNASFDRLGRTRHPLAGPTRDGIASKNPRGLAISLSGMWSLSYARTTGKISRSSRRFSLDRSVETGGVRALIRRPFEALLPFDRYRELIPERVSLPSHQKEALRIVDRHRRVLRRLQDDTLYD